MMLPSGNIIDKKQRLNLKKKVQPLLLRGVIFPSVFPLQVLSPLCQ